MTGLVEDGIEVFKGIPYGAPTALSGRFRPPALPEEWSGERPCSNVGFACPQPQLALAGVAAPTELEPRSEDCLVVNVFTPAADGARRPVMVWFHGGAWTMGSGGSPGYDGRRLARRGDMAKLGVSSLDELVAVPADSLVAAQVELTGGALGGGGAPLGPVLDGRTLAVDMFDPVPAPSSLGVPLLIGTGKDEMTLFSLDIEPDRFGDDRLRSAAQSIFGGTADAAVEDTNELDRGRRRSTDM